MKTDQFITRHSSINKENLKKILDVIGVSSLEGGKMFFCAHEMILDCASLKKKQMLKLVISASD